MEYVELILTDLKLFQSRVFDGGKEIKEDFQANRPERPTKPEVPGNAALDRAKKRIKEHPTIDLERANQSVQRAQNRIRIAKTFSENFPKVSK